MRANWAYGILGIWILISPWLLGFSNISFGKWSNVLCGLVLIVVSSWRLFGEKQKPEETQVK